MCVSSENLLNLVLGFYCLLADAVAETNGVLHNDYSCGIPHHTSSAWWLVFPRIHCWTVVSHLPPTAPAMTCHLSICVLVVLSLQMSHLHSSHRSSSQLNRDSRVSPVSRPPRVLPSWRKIVAPRESDLEPALINVTQRMSGAN